MITFPNAKINLGLHVTAKRPDGFHEIVTVFYPIPWRDALEVVPAEEPSMQVQGLTIEGPVTDNLVWKAYQLLQEQYSLSPVSMHLLKQIPFGAGLGGGSADAAFALQLLNEYANLQLSADALKAYAATLGSDCPFFIDNKPALGEGRGEILSPITIDLAGYHLVVLFPGIAVPTGWAYSQITPALPPIPLEEVMQMPIDQWEIYLTNDFEGPVFAAHPTLEIIKLNLYEKGAVYAAMSGSGSAMYGLFTEPQDHHAIAHHFGVSTTQVLSCAL